MRVHANRDRCISSGQCVMTAPEASRPTCGSASGDDQFGAEQALEELLLGHGELALQLAHGHARLEEAEQLAGALPGQAPYLNVVAPVGEADAVCRDRPGCR